MPIYASNKPIILLICQLCFPYAKLRFIYGKCISRLFVTSTKPTKALKSSLHSLQLTFRYNTSVSERFDLKEARWSNILLRLVVMEPVSSAEHSDEGGAWHAKQCTYKQQADKTQNVVTDKHANTKDKSTLHIGNHRNLTKLYYLEA